MSKLQPTPLLEVFLQRIDEALQPHLRHSIQDQYRHAVHTVFDPSSPLYPGIDELVKSLVSTPEKNWSTDWFMNLLLASRLPLATSNKLTILLNVPDPTGREQMDVAAELLHALAVWAIRPVELYTKVQFALKAQLEALLGTWRTPGKHQDTLKTPKRGDARHVIIWSGGRAWKVAIYTPNGVPLPVPMLVQQLQLISLKPMVGSSLPSLVDTEHFQEDDSIPLAAYSCRLNRTDWAEIFERIHTQSDNSDSLHEIETALATVALEDYEAPSTEADLLDDIRAGWKSLNRYDDKVLGLVVYSNGSWPCIHPHWLTCVVGRAGFTFDHVPSDFGADFELTSSLYSIIREAKSTLTPASTLAAEIAPTHLPLRMPSPPLPPPPPHFRDAIPRKVITFRIAYRRAIRTKRLCDPLMNLCLQYAILKSHVGDPPDYQRPIPLAMYQPCWLRDYKDGRVHPLFPLTVESTTLLAALDPSCRPENAPVPDKETPVLLEEMLERRRTNIKVTSAGHGTDHLRQARLEMYLENLSHRLKESDHEKLNGMRCLPELDFVLQTWNRYLGAERTVHFTGFQLKDEDETTIQAGLSNIYLPVS